MIDYNPIEYVTYQVYRRNTEEIPGNMYWYFIVRTLKEMCMFLKTNVQERHTWF